MIAAVREGKLLTMEGDYDHIVNRGSLCVKGISVFATHASPQRLTKPQCAGQRSLGRDLLGRCHRAPWAAQHVVDAFPDDTAPKWLHRDRDIIYSERFRQRVASMGIAEVVSAPASPWQNPYVERVIGSIRRECLDHVIVLNASHLRRILTMYGRYYHRSRTHLGLEKDAPDPRSVSPSSAGLIVVTPEVGGLHHRYERKAA